ncbi:hypothetical protein F5Y19DRAFT_482857 [Xylariaceae sp. FL1651]|nr:hypothetical protein F5Y19DRAFT_482857 [Xylariaceae sp. FL1651]
MDEDQKPRPSPIEGLSVELVRMILSALPDVTSLQSAVLSCPLLYCAFSKADGAIVADVLLNQVDVSVLPEVIAASESSRLHLHDTEPQSREAIDHSVARNLRQRPTTPKFLSLKEVLSLERFHSCVEQLARQFVEVALTERPALHSGSGTTWHEICRIQRALYRFEIYCNIFREGPNVPSTIYQEQKQLYLANFAPWEHEQLGCIHDFLVRAVSPAFNDVVEHDIKWGAGGVPYGDSIDSPYIQDVLPLGLEKLHQIATTETYRERERFLCPGYSPRWTYSFLYEVFRNANERWTDSVLDTLLLEDLTFTDELLCIKQPFFTDPDSGPIDVWRWAHHEESWHHWVYQENYRDLRKWGYVMWDRFRLEAIGIFQDPWEETDDSEQSLLEEQEVQRERAYLQNSQDQRERLHSLGGTGWWCLVDGDKVRWEHGKPPAQRPSDGVEFVNYDLNPQSLQEAQEMLSMVKFSSRIT